MARPRKRHIQQSLFGPRGGVITPARRAKEAARRHPKRAAKVGRPPKTPGRRCPAHKERPALARYQPVHVVLRVAADLARTGLRRRAVYQAFRAATLAVARRARSVTPTHGAFRIVHVSIQQTHVHLLVEADDKLALARGMQSFQISAAKHINAASTRRGGARRRGAVFPNRYHEEIIRTPRQARHALAYVLNNWRKHREHRGRSWNVDPFSTAVLFSGWREREDEPFMWRAPLSYQPMLVYLPQTWLLRVGWRKAALPISYHDVPSAPHTRPSARS